MATGDRKVQGMVERKEQKKYIERKREREINANARIKTVINRFKEIRDKMRDRISVIWALIDDVLEYQNIKFTNCCITCFLDIFVSITGTAFCMYRTEGEKSLHLAAQENSMKLSRSHARKITSFSLRVKKSKNLLYSVYRPIFHN
jgi:hypothetical protein